MENINNPFIMVIFGGTGDLTHRKLMPAIYNLMAEKLLPEKFAVVSVGRRDKTGEEYLNEVYSSIKKFSRLTPEINTWNKLREAIHYYRTEFTREESYKGLKKYLDGLDSKYGTTGNRLYYLAVAPEFFGPIVGSLKNNGMTESPGAWNRVIIEKPFGWNLESARNLNREITNAFNEDNVFRIDHYLGKEMIQNIMVIRFANAVFESLWNNRYIDNIQISSSEMVGVETRGDYYEKSGVLRDMLQNHMLQLLTLIAMEPPVNLSPDAIRDEKIKVLRSIRPFTSEEVRKNVIRGQYGPGSLGKTELPGYRQEQKVSPESEIETFMALKMHIENFRWAGTPFYLRTGKRLDSKSTEIVIEFKSLPEFLYAKEYGSLHPNLMVIRINPHEGVYFQFNTKRPGAGVNLSDVKMDFCQNCETVANSPEAYERLIHDATRGDSTLFTRWDEVEFSWSLVDSIVNAWKNEAPDFPNYKAGSTGPEDADKLLLEDGRKWWRI